ncbi:hypothetical protein FHW79_006449 [Azospirillum sp. OGB3]|uniref:hypothetical protein n=1 Tax=Azospirillum sp. OGB3 TaxID=2587012 RepID=UPI001606F13C|nr:hypothetical protein [Azospirillum sp. OGB3]MBB3268774.1 hypothetical protein [Azospirillum sp. OGB3]
MSTHTSELQLAARKNLIQNPTSRNADPMEWFASYKLLTNPTDRDKEILRAALTFGRDSIYLYSRYGGSFLEGVSAPTSRKLAIATLNYQCSIIMDKQQAKVKKLIRGGETSLDRLASTPLGGNIQSLSAGDMFDNTVDAVELWLKKNAYVNAKNDVISNYGGVAAAALMYCSIEKGYASLWQQTIWNDWKLIDDDGAVIHAPCDIDKEKLRISWGIRHESKFSQHAVLAISDWKHKMSSDERQKKISRRTVTAIEVRPNGKKEFRVNVPKQSENKPDSLYLTKVSVDNSYLSLFWNENLPSVGVSVSVAVEAFLIISDIAEVLARGLGKRGLSGRECVSLWSLGISVERLKEIFQQCLSVSDEQARVIIEFFSWTPTSYKGLWGAPLVSVSNGSRVCIARPVVSNPNMQRTIEIIMKRGGLTDDENENSRGKPFESNVRREIISAIKRNGILSKSICAEHALKRKGAGEEIDLLFTIGRTLFVGEVKCWMFPSDPLEYANRNRAIEKAASQARKKAAWVKENIERVAGHLGVDSDRLKGFNVVPIVVQNQSYGMSLEVNEVVVTDFDFLALYIGSSRYTAGGALLADGRESFRFESFYHSEIEAEANFCRTMKDPPVLKRFKDRLQWMVNEFPTSGDCPLYFMSGVLGELTGADKALSDAASVAMD